MANWEHNKLTNDELKELVRDVYDCKTFTSFQCGNMIMSVFMRHLTKCSPMQLYILTARLLEMKIKKLKK